MKMSPLSDIKLDNLPKLSFRIVSSSLLMVYALRFVFSINTQLLLAQLRDSQRTYQAQLEFYCTRPVDIVTLFPVLICFQLQTKKISRYFTPPQACFIRVAVFVFLANGRSSDVVHVSTVRIKKHILVILLSVGIGKGRYPSW